jgi:UDP-3-O-[3-hydroxymyristoyl] N-acetylglucosamine deacetylase
MGTHRVTSGEPVQQTTLERWVSVQGPGLHSGEVCLARLGPGAAGTGVVFERRDVPGQPAVRVHPDNLAEGCQCTALEERGVRIGTVEHLLAALAGLGVDNVRVVLDREELPILDGSARPWAELLQRAGLRSLPAHRVYLGVTRPVEVRSGDRRLRIAPGAGLCLDCTVDFEHPLIHRQRFVYRQASEGFLREIGPARTFGFLPDVKRMQASGLARGGSLESAVVLDDFSVLNPGGLRFPDEFARHKALDLLGDLALLGAPILGRVTAYKAGHRLHQELVKKLHARSAELVRLVRVTASEREEDRAAAFALADLRTA